MINSKTSFASILKCFNMKYLFLAAILNLGGLVDPNSQVQCSAPLPDPKPLAGIDDECVAR